MESSGGSTPLAVLSTLTSVQVGVLLFLETWLNLVPEDFMLCMCTLNSDTKTAMTTTNCDDDFKRPFSSFSWSDSDEKNSYFSDVLDVLVNFINILSQDRTLTSLGLCQNEQHDDRPSVEISPGSLLSDHFPCVSKLIVLVNDNFELEVEEGDKTLVSHEDRDVVNDKCDSGVKKESPELVANAVEDVELTLPPEPVLSTVSPKRSHIPRPLSLNPKDQGYYKHQLERVFTGEIKDRESLTSLRMSFFDTFGDDSLSEILEFESEVAGNLGDARPESWKNYVAPKSRFENTSTAIANENISQIDNVDDTSKSSTVSQVASGSSAGADSFDGISFFKSLFQKSNVIEKVDNAPNEIADDVSVGKLVVSESFTSDILPQDSHVIALSSKSKECPSTGKRPLLFVPQDLVPSALAAASMGIRVSTLAPRTSSRDSPLNIPLGFCDTNFISPKNKPISESEISLVLPKSTRSHYKYAASLRSLVVRTLAKVNEDSFTSCIEMYSYFGMMLSAVELRTAQDYVASSDLSMEIEVPARLFVDPIDRYIIRYNSTDALSSEKISYLVKSSREESELLPVENVREITPPSADRTRTPVSSHSTSDASSLYVYDPDFNNSSSATDQQNKRNKHRKEQRRRTMGSYLSQRVADYSKKSSSRRQTILSSENSRRISGSKTSSPPKSEVGGRRTSFSSSAGSHSMSSRSSSFSMSEALFGSSHVYLGPSIFLDFQIYQVAANLTMRLHYMFCTIPMLEFVVDYVYAYDAKSNIRNRTPMLTRFRKESEKLQTLFIGEVLVHPDVSTRAEVVIKMIKVAEHLAKMRSHHALMLVVYALHTHAIYRLKSTWAVVHAKLPGRWDVLTELVGMGGNKLVAFFCQRQPRNGISNDVREEMFLELDKPLLNRHNECEDCSNDRSASRDSNDKNSRYDNFHFERLRLGEVPISPKRRVHTYSSDSNSSLGYSDSTVEEEQRDTSPADNDDDVVHQGGESVFGNVCDVNNGDEVSPFSTTSACFSKKDADDKEERNNNKHLNIPISMKIIDLRKCDFANECQKQNDRPRVGFHFMASGLPSQPSSSAADKILSYESTSSLASLAGSSGKIRDKEDESFPVVAKVKAPVNDNWQVEKSTKVGPSAESENIEVFSDTESDTPSSVASSIENTEIKLPMTSSIEDSNVRSNQTVDILMSFSGDEETTREAAPIDPGPVSYRYLQVRSLSLRPPQSGLGEVKSDGLTSSHAFSGQFSNYLNVVILAHVLYIDLARIYRNANRFTKAIYAFPERYFAENYSPQ